jgi:hypothetical protein
MLRRGFGTDFILSDQPPPPCVERYLHTLLPHFIQNRSPPANSIPYLIGTIDSVPGAQD